MLFTERSAAEFISGDTEGGRPPGRRQLERSVQQPHRQPALMLDAIITILIISLNRALSLGSSL